MTENLKSLKDIFVVRAEQDLCDLSVADKVAFCDQAMNGSTESRGITVTFNLSSSARRINNRIYTPRGQRAGLDTWTRPYGKPILVHHDRMKDPIGRLIDVEYVENDQEAMRFFRSIQDFANFKAIVESDEPKAIYRSLLANNLISNPAWPGLGHLRARARITDREAIQKFLDERYLTFSAGTHSDRYVCGVCNEDWAKGDMCEHMPGKITDDGEPVVFITGTFFGDEASVVNEPANNLSTVQSIVFADSVSTEKIDLQSTRIDPQTIYYVDGLISRGESMETEETQTQDTQETGTQEVEEVQNTTADPAVDLQAALNEMKKEILDQIAVLVQQGIDERAQSVAAVGILEVQSTDAVECEACSGLKKDYESALLRIETLQQDIENLKNSQTVLDTASQTGQNGIVDSSLVTDLPARVENPSIGGNGTGAGASTKKLGDYEKKIVERYLDIKTEQGQPAADLFVGRKIRAGHLPSNFNITNFIQESD